MILDFKWVAVFNIMIPTPHLDHCSFLIRLKRHLSAQILRNQLTPYKTMKSLKRLTIVSMLLACASVAFAKIDRVEPENWWVGMKEPTFQLMLHGNGIGGSEVKVDGNGVTLKEAITVDSPNYLFLYLSMSEATGEGVTEITLSKDGKMLETINYSIKARMQKAEDFKGFDNTDVLYLLMPDRFANGDPSNDVVEGTLEAKVDRAEPYGRHGGDLQGLIDRLDYLQDLGVTGLWLNPVTENDMPDSSYHGYATTDFYKVDPRLGTNELYRELADEGRERGIKIVLDMVFNQCGVEHWWMEDLPTKDWINHIDEPKMTNHLKTANLDPYVAPEEKELLSTGWFVPSMPDMNLRNPLLKDYLIQNTIWWTEYLGLGGIRMDTHPYPDKHAMSEWGARMMMEYPNFNITGEEWNGNPVIVAYWQDDQANPDGYDGNTPSMLDFPFQESIHRAFSDEGPRTGVRELYDMLAMDALYTHANNNVTFFSNHDMARFYMVTGESLLKYKNALVFLTTSRGIPHLYYGDEVLMTHHESWGHGHIRNNFYGGWEGDEKDAVSGKGLTKEEKEAQSFTKKLLNWRKNASAVHYGKLLHYLPQDDIYVYFRSDDSQQLMIVINDNEKEAQLDLERFAPAIGDFKQGTDVLSGKTYSLEKPLKLKAQTPLVLELM
jgi:glycosidase